MAVNSCPSLLKRLTTLFGIASLGALTSVPVAAQMEANSPSVNLLAANNSPKQQVPLRATTGINLIAQVGLRSIADELILANDAFSTLTAALRSAGLLSTLARGGSYTIFAPTDEAFRALPRDTVPTLLLPRNRERLTRILTYHVVPGNYRTFRLRRGTVTRLRTLQGQYLTLRVTDASEVYVNGNKVIMADIPARNGTIHGLSAVLLP